MSRHARRAARCLGVVSLVASLSALAGAGCAAPRIDRFSASPRRICPGSSSVTLAWSVDGSASLHASPEIASLGRVASSGTTTVPAKEATVTLTASKLLAGSVRSEQVLSFVRADETTTLGPDSRDVTCDEARREAVAVVAFEPEEFDANVQVHALENGWDREVVVAHRGRAWAVPAGAAVPLSPRPGPGPDLGVLAGGPWVIRAKLREDEHCGSPSAGALLHMLLEARLGC